MVVVYGTKDKTIRIEKWDQAMKEMKSALNVGANGSACRIRFTDGTEILVGYTAMPEITWFIMDIHSGPAAKLFCPHERRAFHPSDGDHCSDLFKIDAELEQYFLIDLWDTAQQITGP